MSRANLFPAIEPNRTGTLDLDGGHVMYWEESGRRDGVPVLFLHGGPGAGSSAAHRRYFDPKYYRIVIFDQRGAGRSRPAAALEDNTTPHLVEDIETLRRQAILLAKTENPTLAAIEITNGKTLQRMSHRKRV